MPDKRPYAKIDTGYMMNPKWFQVERELRIDDRIDQRIDVRSLVRTAREAHIASILYCAQNVTDGLFPVEVVKSLAMVRPEEEPAITALFEVGLWINEKGGLARVHDYLEHQTSAAKVKQWSEAGKKGAAERETNRTSNRSANRTSNRSSQEKRREENIYTPYKSPTGDDAPKSKTKRKPAAKYSADFEAFWAAFPKDRKVGKTKCWGKFEAAVESGVDPQAIIDAAQRYNNDPNREPQYTTMPETWLNQERWEAGPLPPRGGTQPASQAAWEADMRQFAMEPQASFPELEGGLS